MIRMVKNPKLDYKKKGIIVCSEWSNPDGFKAFAEWAYSHGYDENKKLSENILCLIDENGNFEPNNCRFTNVFEIAWLEAWP